MLRSQVTSYLFLCLRSRICNRFRVYREVSIRKVPAFCPKGFSETWHFDAMAMEGQRASGKMPFAIIGFEIKSCRQDFLTDTKWQNYLNRVDRFIFVCPPGAVTKQDVKGTPAGIWEVEPTVTGNCLWCKEVKAHPMEVSNQARFDAMYGLAINANRFSMVFPTKEDVLLKEQLGRQWYRELIAPKTPEFPKVG